MKTCKKCGTSKPLDQFYKNSGCTKDGHLNKCKECVKDAQNSRPKVPTDEATKIAYRNRLKRVYGITEDDHDEMFIAQQGCCAICSARPDKLVVDHCHKTGKVRGLLCKKCNMAIGKLGDTYESIMKVAKYLKQTH